MNQLEKANLNTAKDQSDLIHRLSVQEMSYDWECYDYVVFRNYMEA